MPAPAPGIEQPGDPRARSAALASDLLASTRDRLDVSRDEAIHRFDPALRPSDVGAGTPADAPDVLISRYERLLARDAAARTAAGAWFTPPALVDAVLDRAGVGRGDRVCDPACGAGAFLLAASRRGARVTGMDVDPVAAAVARAVLWWAGGAPWSAYGGADVRSGDALLADWGGERFDAVVGNPPFLGQLSVATVHTRERARRLAARWGVTAYADAAALFQLLGASLLAPGGRLALLAPASLLASRDAGPIRRALTALSPESLWIATDRTFSEAAVHPTLVVLRHGPGPALVRRFRDAAFIEVEPVSIPVDRWRAEGRWSPWLAGAVGIPDVALDGPPLGTRAEVTADFRDQYYGLADAIEEDGSGPPLITVGAIEPGRSRWGERPIRFAKRTWRRPTVALSRLGPEMAAWAESRLRPKVLVATQTRVIEVVADPHGAWLPSVPVISVIPRDPADLWHLAAALASPAASAWAAALTLGTGLTPGAIKLAAREVRELPLPVDPVGWERAAASFRAGGSAAAYGAIDASVAAWWAARAGVDVARGRR